MQALDVSVKAMTLLSEQVEINSIVLEKPVFEFRVDKTGHNNWNLRRERREDAFAELQTPDPSATPTRSPLPTPIDAPHPPKLG